MVTLDKNSTAVIGILSLVILQVAAWYTGHDGQVFALTSAGIGALVGLIAGFKVSLGK